MLIWVLNLVSVFLNLFVIVVVEFVVYMVPNQKYLVVLTHFSVDLLDLVGYLSV